MSDKETGVPDQQPDHQLSEEQNYRETVRGVRSFLGWHQVPEFESSASSQEAFDGPRTKPTGKVSVKLPSDYWLRWKMENLNLTLTESYPTCSTDWTV